MIWGKNKGKSGRSERKQLAVELANHQKNSLLQEFINYTVSTKQENKVDVSTRIGRDGDFAVEVRFEKEMVYVLTLLDSLAFEAQDDPQRLIDALYEDEEFEVINSELHRLEEILAEQEELLRRGEKLLCSQQELCRRLGDRASQRTLSDLDGLKIMNVQIESNIEEHSAYLETIWFNSPYFPDRLEAVYDSFLLQRTVNSDDPVEADLMKMLTNERLSEQTKERASQLLVSYRKQQKLTEEEAVRRAEEEKASHVFSTVEQHYLKGESRK